MRLSFRLQVLGGFLTVLLALGGLMYLAIKSNTSYQNFTRQIIQFNQALYHLEQVRAWSMEMETTQRGFIITYDSAFLEPYIKSAAMLEDNVQNLGMVTASFLDEDQIPALQRLSRRKKDSTQRILMARHHSFDSARKVIGSYAGKQITDSIRVLTDNAESKITTALRDMRRKRDAEMGNAQLQVGITIVTTTIVLIVLFGLIDYNQQKRLKAEEKLALTLKEKQSLYQQAPCGYFTIGDNGLFLRANDTFLSFIRYSRDALLQMDMFEVLAPDSAETIRASLEKYEGKEPLTVDLDLITSDGQPLPVTGSLRKIDPQSSEIRFTVIDCSEKRKAENRIRELNTELEEFSYCVSHDLRSPLRVISGYTLMLKEDHKELLNEDSSGIIDVIVRNTQKMGQLIDDLLAFAKLTRSEVKKQPVSFEEMISAAYAEVTESMPGRKAELRIDNILPAQSDILLMKQVWLNLLSNAVKYSSHNDHPVIEVGSYTDNQSVCYFVRDNGVGFDMTYASQLFKVFQRLHRDDEFPGTGVGLALVRKIITRQGGQVWAESTPGSGATFYFSLPNY